MDIEFLRKILLDLYIGNKNSILIYDKGYYYTKYKSAEEPKKHFNGNWDYWIKYHFKRDFQIGTHPIYWISKTPFVKFVALDVDIHEKEESEEAWDDIKKKINLVINKSKEYFYCDKKYIIIEKTRRGFHLWILLRNKTRLKTASDYIDMIRPKLNQVFGDVEIFPKQSFEDMKSNKSLGNAIKLPQILPYKFYLLNLENPKIKSQIDEFRKKIAYHTSTKVNKIPINIDLTGVEAMDTVYKEVPDVFVRPCLKAVIDGRIKAVGRNGHLLRVAVANELLAMGLSINEVVSAFKNQKDFDQITTYKYVRYQLLKQSRSGKNLRFKCSTIRDLGFCLTNCYKKGNVHKTREIKTEKQEINGWTNLHKVLNKLIKQNSRGVKFLRKTTRSGTTSATIIQAINARKNILVIAPTKRIFNKTIMEADQIAHENKLYKGEAFFGMDAYRIKSNYESCKVLQAEVDKLSHEGKRMFNQYFPFLLKPTCSKCPISHECQYNNFIKNMHKRNVIYISMAKLKAMLSVKTEHVETTLDKLIEWSDVIFIDECSHIFSINYWSKYILNQELKSNKMVRYDFLEKCKDIISKLKGFTKTESMNVFISLVRQLINSIERVITREFLPNKSHKFHRLTLDEVKFLVQETPNDWMIWYQQLWDIFKKNSSEFHAFREVIESLFVLTSREVYLQQIISLDVDGEYRRRIILGAFDDVNLLARWLRKVSHDKLLIMTDAVFPPIEIDKFFTNFEEVYIGDPNKTADKQKIVIYDKDDPFFYTTKKSERTKRILDFLNKYNIKEGAFVVLKNKSLKSFYSKNIKKDIENVKEDDYYRGDKTIGVKSDLRQMLVMGSPQPPRHSYDFVAHVFRKAGYLDQFDSDEEAGRYLENYSAASAFFQAISRVKDPMGKEESCVYIYGIPKYKIEGYLDLGVPTPEIIEDD